MDGRDVAASAVQAPMGSVRAPISGRLNHSDKVDTRIAGGAIAGGAIRGAGGAIIGAVIGGIAGGISTACATD